MKASVHVHRPDDSPDLLKKIELGGQLVKNREQIYQVPLVSLDCSFDTVRTRDTAPLKDVVKKHRKGNGADVIILFAVRRPGCPSCREHAQQLDKFSASDRHVALIASVKETGTTDRALLDFYRDYFRGNAMYLDEKWKIYNTLARKEVNLMKSLIDMFGARKRLAAKNIKGDFGGGEGFMQGGVLVFGKRGELRFVLEDNPFQELDMDLLAAAVAEARK